MYNFKWRLEFYSLLMFHNGNLSVPSITQNLSKGIDFAEGPKTFLQLAHVQLKSGVSKHHRIEGMSLIKGQKPGAPWGVHALSN